MYSYNINSSQYNNYNTVKSVKALNVSNDEPVKDSKPSFTSNPIMTQIPFNPSFAASNLRTVLSSNDEKNKYNELTKLLDKDSRKAVECSFKNRSFA